MHLRPTFIPKTSMAASLKTLIVYWCECLFVCCSDSQSLLLVSLMAGPHGLALVVVAHKGVRVMFQTTPAIDKVRKCFCCGRPTYMHVRCRYYFCWLGLIIIIIIIFSLVVSMLLNVCMCLSKVGLACWERYEWANATHCEVRLFRPATTNGAQEGCFELGGPSCKVGNKKDPQFTNWLQRDVTRHRPWMAKHNLQDYIYTLEYSDFPVAFLHCENATMGGIQLYQ